MPKKSMIWDFFTKTDDSHAKCNECGAILVSKNGSTSGIGNHLKRHPQSLIEFEQRTDSQAVLNSNGAKRHNDSESDNDEDFIHCRKRARLVMTPGSSILPHRSTNTQKTPKTPRTARVVSQWPKDHPENVQIVTEITKWIKREQLSFKIVDSEGFRTILSLLTKGKYNPISSTSLSRLRIPKLYQFVQDHISKIVNDERPYLDGAAFTTDIWTTQYNNLSFQSLTLHFINNRFELKRLLVKLDYFGEKHTGEIILEKLDLLIKGLNLEQKTHTWATTDGGTNVLKAMRLGKASQLPSINDNLWCADHQIHLIVTDALKAVPAWKELSSKLSKLVGHFNHSPKNSSILRKIALDFKQSRTKLVQNVSTRWNSDLKMLQSIIDLEGCIAKMAETSTVIKGFLPSLDEILIMKGVLNCLEPFEKMSRALSSDKEPTMNLVFMQLVNVRRKLVFFGNHSTLTCVSEISEKLVEGLDARFPNSGIETPEYVMCHFLDPRYKGSVINFADPEKYELIKVTAVQAIIDMKKRDGSESPTSNEISSPTLLESEEDEQEDVWEQANKKLYGKQQKRQNSKDDSFKEAQNEETLYVEEGCVHKDSNILQYWNNQQNKFPYLTRLARKMLCIPASSSTSERVFSTAGNILTERRTCLSIDNIEMLVFMKENMKEMNNITWPGFEENENE
ncbi:zinc finger BED domain-containing protein 4-like [Hydra vulgaris]|uniref:Zinc finger BED domain-containing protein 4-like n=1 Tax=Hydra vulgaris TaxID=6087 RepID=A0ABM4DI49_HYDVU